MASTGEVIRDIVIALTPFGMAYLAFKQSQIANRQKVIHGQIDGMKTELVEAVKGRGEAEGKIQGIEQAKGDAATVIKDAKSTAETLIKDAKDAAATLKDAASTVQEVKIVEQAKPIDVKNVDPKKEK